MCCTYLTCQRGDSRFGRLTALHTVLYKTKPIIFPITPRGTWDISTTRKDTFRVNARVGGGLFWHSCSVILLAKFGPIISPSSHEIEDHHVLGDFYMPSCTDSSTYWIQSYFESGALKVNFQYSRRQDNVSHFPLCLYGDRVSLFDNTLSACSLRSTDLET